MDIRFRFENLVNNKYMDDFDYLGYSFSFETLFGKRSLNYKMCSCAVEHETVQYISENGDINREMYEKILQCILNGKCPHVDGEPEDDVAKTKIYGIQVAVAAGTMLAAEKIYELKIKRICLYPYSLELRSNVPRPSRLLKVHPCAVAAMKTRYDILKVIVKTSDLVSPLMPLWVKSTDDDNLYHLETISYLECCVRQNDATRLLRYIQIADDPILLDSGMLTLHPYLHILTYALKYCSLPVQRVLCKSLQNRTSPSGAKEDIPEDVLFMIAENIIILNKPEILKLFQIGLWRFPERINELRNICNRLNRKECLSVIRFLHTLKHEQHEQNDNEREKIAWYLHQYMEHYAELKDEIIPILRGNPNPHLYDIISYELQRYFDKMSDSAPTVKKLPLKALRDIGIDINTWIIRSSCLLKLLGYDTKGHYRLRINYEDFREQLELILNENIEFEAVIDSIKLPDTCISGYCNRSKNSARKQSDREFSELNRRIKFEDFLGLIVLLDLDLKENRRLKTVCRGDFILDARMHAHSRHDMYVYHFVLPLFIECGLSITRSALANVIENPLHNKELEYLRRCLEKPRSLTKQCRDVLRKYFKGRRIRTYLDVINVSASIRKFILCKDVLLLTDD